MRMAQGFSQIDLAANAGSNHNFIGEIERAEKIASVDGHAMESGGT